VKKEKQIGREREREKRKKRRRRREKRKRVEKEKDEKKKKRERERRERWNHRTLSETKKKLDMRLDHPHQSISSLLCKLALKRNYLVPNVSFWFASLLYCLNYKYGKRYSDLQAT